MGPLTEAAALLRKYAGNPHFERGCHGKVQYADEKTAKVAAKRLHKMKKCKFNAYQCLFCFQWHTGHDRRGLRKEVQDDTTRTP